MTIASNSDVDLPEEIKTHLERAYYYEEQDLFTEALDECAVVLELMPDCAEGYNLRGILLEELGQIEQAVGAYRIAVQYDATFLEAQENLCEAEVVWKKAQRTLAHGPLAGFWRRIFAFGVDFLILSLPLLLVGWFVVPDIAFSMGPWGRFIGIGVMTLYFGWGNSSMRHGQTIGKRWLKITVVDATGKYLSMRKSMGRSLLLTLIIMVGDWALLSLKTPLLQMVLSGIAGGFGLAVVYGLVFNRITRQGIHDLLVGSYVVVSARVADASFSRCLPRHKRVMLGLVLIGFLLGFSSVFEPQVWVALGWFERGEGDRLMALNQLLRSEGNFFSVEVKLVREKVMGVSHVAEVLEIEVWTKQLCRRDLVRCQEPILEVARLVLDEYANLDQLAGLRIIVESRFDWGLGTGRWGYRETHPVDVWRRMAQ